MIKESILRERLVELVDVLKTRIENQDGKPRGTYVSETPAASDQQVDELLDYLQLRAKYIVFDLEATRRENRYLRQMLEHRTNPEEGPETF